MKTTIAWTKTAAITALISSVLTANTPARAASCHVYQVNLQDVATIGGSIATLSGQQFSVQEYAMWRSPGWRSHQVEFWLTPTQDLSASAQLGQIALMTNTRFADHADIRSAQYDLASVSVTNVVRLSKKCQGQSQKRKLYGVPSQLALCSPNIKDNLEL
jgi:hypothetical protein